MCRLSDMRSVGICSGYRRKTLILENKEASLFKRFERVLKITIENYIGDRHENR
jgi:hypothetical protein